MSEQIQSVDFSHFRQVLGQYPTGVCAVTAMQDDGTPVGMVIGSFTSASLDPPLVAFLPMRSSGRWARLREAKRFCVNVLSAEQEAVCRKLASREPDTFSGVPYRLSPGGAPIIGGAVAWIECDLYSISEAGDHLIVVGLVRQLEIETEELPLLFFQGGYGRFTPSSIMASDTRGLLTNQLRVIDDARPEMERIAASLSARCVALTRVDDELIVAAAAGGTRASSLPHMVGQRVPFIAPLGSAFAAFMDESTISRWIGHRDDEKQEIAFRQALATVRRRGYSIGLFNEAMRDVTARLQVIAQASGGSPAPIHDAISNLDYDPDELSGDRLPAVRLITAPVFDRKRDVILCLTVLDSPRLFDRASFKSFTARLLEGTASIGNILQRMI